MHTRACAGLRLTWEWRCIGVGAITSGAAGILLASYGVDLSSLHEMNERMTRESLVEWGCMLTRTWPDGRDHADRDESHRQFECNRTTQHPSSYWMHADMATCTSMREEAHMAVDDAHCTGVIKGDPVGVVIGSFCGVEVPEIGALRMEMWCQRQ